MGAGEARSYPLPPVQAPFAGGSPVEGDRIVAIEVGSAVPQSAPAAFADGIQRWALEGRFGLVPVVRGYVAAAVLKRDNGTLRAACRRVEEFLVAPLGSVTPAQRASLDTVGLEVIDCDEAERSHPMLDVQRAVEQVGWRRDAIESRVVHEYLAGPHEGWLVLDGSLSGLGPDLPSTPRVVGLIKSHETQFLRGRDLETALTLGVGSRTSVFERRSGTHGRVYTWYLRMWPWDERDLLYGLVRLERPAGDGVVEDADAVSRWMLAERAPLAAPDARWDRLIYPIRQVESYLRAHAGGW